MKKIFISPELVTILKEIIESNSKDKTLVAKTLLDVSKGGIKEEHLLKDYCNYFTISTESKKFISYVKREKLAEKIVKYNDDIKKKSDVTEDMLQDFNEKFFSRKVPRTRAKPSKFISRIFTKEYIKENIKASDVENFTNQFQSIIRDKVDIRLVKGKDIKKYYLLENYETDCPSGSLKGSCMAPESRNKLIDFYVDKKNVSMLVAFSENNKVIGRAIVWDDVKFYKNNKLVDEGSFMDRIYYTYDWLISKFKKWAKDNDCYVKYKQSHDDLNQFIAPDQQVHSCKIEIDLDLKSQFYPYMDTVCFPDYERGLLTNVPVKEEFSKLRAHANGIPSRVFDFLEGKVINANSSKWSDHSKTYVHLDDSIEISDEYFHKKICEKDRLGGYITPKDEKVKCVVTNDTFPKRDMIKSDYHKGFIHKSESVKSVDAGNIHKSDSVKSKYLGKILSKKGSIKLEKVDDYLPKEILESGVNIEQLEKVIESLNKIQGEKTEDDDSSTFVFEF